MGAGRIGIWVLIAGCGEGRPTPVPSGDAGNDGGIDGSVQVTAPDPPAPPRLTPCADGWRVVADADEPGIETCDPWPVSGHADCGGDAAHFPGSPGCEPLGPGCPEGAFAEGLPAANVLHVDPAAPAGGDGSRAAPVRTIAEAIAAAPDGAVIALARGTHAGGVELARGLTLWGACVGETEIEGAVGAVAVLIRGEATVRDLRISGGEMSLRVEAAATLASVRVEAAGGIGVQVAAGASLAATDVAIADGGGPGLDVAGAADLTRTVVERVTGGGIRVPGGTLVGRRVAVDEVGPVAAEGAGWGIEAFGGATVDLGESAVERAIGAAVFASGSGTRVGLRDCVLRDTLWQRAAIVGGVSGIGVDARSEGAALLERVWIHQGRQQGIRAIEGSRVTATDVVVSDTETTAAGFLGFGLSAATGSAIDVLRLGVLRARGAGVAVADEGTELRGTDLQVIRTGSSRRGEVAEDDGYGLQVYQRGAVDLERTLVARCRRAGVAVFDATATLRHFAVEETLERACAASECAGAGGGTGLASVDGSAVEVTAFRGVGNALCGVQVARGAQLDLADGEVSGNVVGANVQVEGYDLDRLTRGVIYRDNGRDLDADALPLPEPIGG